MVTSSYTQLYRLCAVGQKRSLVYAGLLLNRTSYSHMTPAEIITHQKMQIAGVLALAATCIFGRLSVLATASAFENLTPTSFEQLAWLWNFLRWSVPAILVGTLVETRVIAVAAAVSLISAFVLLAMEFSSFVAIGSKVPDPMYFEGAAMELGASIGISVMAATVVRTSYRWAAILLTQRPPAQPYE